MRLIRIVIASVLYFAIVILLMTLGYKFTGLVGGIALGGIAFFLHAIVDLGLSFYQMKSKKEDTHV